MAITQKLSLVEKFMHCSKDQFPNGTDYVARYVAIKNYFDEHVHPNVTPAASFKDGGYLTDHGPDHVKTVMARASDILQSSTDEVLTCYEIYLLLVAIHIHDIGNMHGRDGHEAEPANMIQGLEPLLGYDGVEKRTITKIAEAHSGRYRGDKDRITYLLEQEFLLGKQIHPRYMAALLRFADELADDRNRTKYLLVNLVPKESEIFHRYALALQPPIILGNTVRLSFDMPREDALRTFQKGRRQVYLLDEIFDRSAKMHHERMYCMRFLRPSISIDRIEVSIGIYPAGYVKDPIATIDFRMEEAGYPDAKKNGLLTICPSLGNHEYGSPLNGKALKLYLERS